MIKVGLNVALNEDIQKRKKESISQLLKDKDIDSFVKKYQISNKTLNNHWIELLDFYDDKKICQNCRGIDFCKKVTKGMAKELVYSDGNIITPLKYCKYGKEKEAQQEVLLQFVYNNLSPSLALTDISKNKFVVNPQKLSPQNINTISKIVSYIKNPVNKGFYLQGESGSGKTVLMAGVLNSLARSKEEVGICHFPSFLLDLKSSFNSSNDNSYVNQLLHIPYLLIDGIGEENISTWSRDEILLTILSYREINQLPTFFTSMYPLSLLNEVYLTKRNDRIDKIRAQKIVSKISSLTEELVLENQKL